jgi:hypothetical protein
MRFHQLRVQQEPAGNNSNNSLISDSEPGIVLSMQG